jgi:hypothetical protein
MSADPIEHADEISHAHDPAEEITHIKQHAVQNIFWFIGFFSLILLNVLVYEFCPANIYVILLLAASRAILIAFFMNWLFREFSLVFRTFLFTVLFLGGMVFLSWWDSSLKGIGDPIGFDANKPAQQHVP